MATKTVVCPECGSAAAPGRYACAECGALLAAVALTPRHLVSIDAAEVAESAGVAAPSSPEVAAAAPAEVAGDDSPTVDDAAGSDATGSDAAGSDAAGSDAAGSATLGTGAPDRDHDHAGDALDQVGAAVAAASLAFDEDAPLAAAAHLADDIAVSPETWQPDVLHPLADEAPLEDGPPPALTDMADAAPPPAPSWPPPGAAAVLASREQRTPAGAYLPPSAVLPPLDGGPALAAGAAGAGAGSAGTGAGANATGVPVPERSGTDWLARGSTAIGGAFGSVEVTADASRRAVAAGAGLAAVGLLLPWVNSLPGTSPFTGYLDRWGLAGPGLWLVLIGLLGLTAVAVSSGRAATWPVGLPALMAAAFIAGLIWPYLVGGFGRPIGIWVMAVAVVVLAVAGILDRRSRHEGPEPAVQGGDR